MKILVEKRPIDFELEGGESLQEVVSALKEWAAKGNNLITDLKLNGKAISLEDAAKSCLKVEEIETLELGVQGIEEMALSGLYEASDYLPRLIAGAEEDVTDLARIREFTDGLIWLNGIISRAGSLLNLDYNKITIDEEPIERKRVRLKEIEGLLSEKIREEEIEEASLIIKDKAKPLLEDWKVLFPKLIEMVLSQKVGSQTTLKRLKEVSKMQDLSKQIEEVSIDLQTGNERKAMEEFQGIIDRLTDMIHLLQEVKISFGLDYRAIQVKDQTVEQRSEELDELLSEIITAFENEDLVMLADLLEYELSPLLSRWEEVILAITVEVEKKIN